MATREQLERALMNAHNAGDVEAARMLAVAIKSGQFTQEAEQAQEVAAEQASVEQGFDPEIPTDEALQADQQRAAEERERKSQRTVGDYATGVGESLLTTATGATGGALGYGVGAIEGAIGELTGNLEQGEAEKVAQERAASLTYAPRTEVGQEITSDIGDALGALPPVLGMTPIAQLRAAIPNKQITKAALKSPKYKRQLIADQIRDGNTDIANVTKMLNESGEVVTNKAAKATLKTLAKDIGDEHATAIVTVVERMNPASKAQLSKMLDVVEKGKKDPIFGQTNRPSDILGNSVAERGRAIAKLNKQASNQIGNIAKSIDSEVDISRPVGEFFNKMQELGVKFERGDDGWVKPDFSRSKFIGGSQKDMTVLINDLMSDSPKFDDAHKLKRFIRDNIDFDAVGPGQIKGESQKILKDLASGIDSILDEASPQYAKANEKFALTVELRDRFNKLSGGEIDLFDEAANKSLGGKARRLVSNAESRVAIEDLIRQSEGALKKHGVRFKDDIPSLNYAVTQLENIFKIEPPGSFQGRIQRAGENIVRGEGITKGATDAAISYLKDTFKPDDAAKLKAIRDLIKPQSK